MPGFTWNLVMCFLMGIGAGGMLPILFALLAETMPARHRGWLMVLVGGDVAGAYLATSWLATALVPHYSWRILWLAGLLLLLLNRWIPESPRFLAATGRAAEAEAVMTRYGARPVPEVVGLGDRARRHLGSGSGQLFRAPFTRLTGSLVLLALGVGLLTYGFQLWVPSNLQHLGLGEVAADRLLRDSEVALLGLPLTVLSAWLYSAWSSRWTIVALTGLTVAALAALAAAHGGLLAHRALLAVLLAVPIWATGQPRRLTAVAGDRAIHRRSRSTAAVVTARPSTRRYVCDAGGAGQRYRFPPAGSVWCQPSHHSLSGSSPAVTARERRAAVTGSCQTSGVVSTIRASSVRRRRVTSCTRYSPAGVSVSRTSRRSVSERSRPMSPLRTRRSHIRVPVEGLTPSSVEMSTTRCGPREAARPGPGTAGASRRRRGRPGTGRPARP